MRLLAALSVVIAASMALATTSSSALPPDSDAPVGSDANWLPTEQWVMERWLPFDEEDLERVLQVDSSRVWAEIGRTGKTLSDVALARGVTQSRLLTELQDGRATPRESTARQVLRARTLRVLTQPHLAEHMLFHPFHTWSVLRNSEQVFGVSQARFDELLQRRRLSFTEIAEVGQRSPKELRRRVLSVSRQGLRQGLEIGGLSVAQYRRALAVDKTAYAQWARYRLPPARAQTARAVPRFVCGL